VSALLKVGYPGDGCVYSRKIVFLDEAHNLVRTQTKYIQQLQKLHQQLFVAQESVVVGFTGTPIGDESSSGRKLLQAFNWDVDRCVSFVQDRLTPSIEENRQLKEQFEWNWGWNFLSGGFYTIIMAVAFQSMGVLFAYFALREKPAYDPPPEKAAASDV